MLEPPFAPFTPFTPFSPFSQLSISFNLSISFLTHSFPVFLLDAL